MQTGQQSVELWHRFALQYLYADQARALIRAIKCDTWPEPRATFHRPSDEDSFLSKVLMTFRDIVLAFLWCTLIVYAMSYFPWLFEWITYLAQQMFGLFIACISWPFSWYNWLLNKWNEHFPNDSQFESGHCAATLPAPEPEYLATEIWESLTERVTDSLVGWNHWAWGSTPAKDVRSQQTKGATRLVVDTGLSGFVQIGSLYLWLCFIQKVWELLQRLLGEPLQLFISGTPRLASLASGISCPNWLRVVPEVLSWCWESIKQYLICMPVSCIIRLLARLWFYQSIQSTCVQNTVEDYTNKIPAYIETLYNKLVELGRNQANYSLRNHHESVQCANAMNQTQRADIRKDLCTEMTMSPMKTIAFNLWFTPSYMRSRLFKKFEDRLPAWHGLARGVLTVRDAPTFVSDDSRKRDQNIAEAAQRTARRHSRIAYGLCLCTVLLAGYMCQPTSFDLLRSQCNEIGTAFNETIMKSTETPQTTWQRPKLDSLDVTAKQVAAHIHTSSEDMVCFDSVYTEHLVNDPHKDPHDFSIRNKEAYITETKPVYEYYKNQTDSRTAFVAKCVKTTAARRKTIIGYAEMFFTHGLSPRWPEPKDTCATEFQAHNPGPIPFSTSELDAIRAKVECFSDDPFVNKTVMEHRTPTWDDLKNLFKAEESCVCGATILFAFFAGVCVVFGIRELTLQSNLLYLKCRN